MKTPRLLLALALAGLVAPIGGGASTAAVSPSAPPAVPTLVEIRAAHHPGFDRVVFEFDGGVPTTHRVRYVSKLIADGSGRRVRVAGRAVLRVVFDPAAAHDSAGPTTAGRTAYALPNVLTTVRAGDFESVTTYGIGLAKKTPFRVFTLQGPGRVVVDIHAAFRTTPRQVWLLDEENFVANQQPFFRPVSRAVPTAHPVIGVLDRLFAGPVPAERADGLRLLRSKATGFADLRIADGVARVRMTGGCSSGGSTVSIAGEIMPTLRQFPDVDWVKIYDPRGRTERPRGHTDSIPACLEP